MTWYKKAADKGYALAQYNLGILYEGGKGVKKDVQQAKIWYKKAADQGEQNAEEALKRLSK